MGEQLKIVSFLGLVYVQAKNGAFVKGPFVDSGNREDVKNTAYARALRYIHRRGEQALS